jgi:MFS family permease
LSIACITTLCLLPLAQNLHTLVVISIIYGFLSGGVIILPGPTLADLCPTKAEIGTRMGLAYLVAAFGGLLGNPATGAIKGDTGHVVDDFKGVWWCGAVIMAVGLLALVGTRWLKLGSAWAAGRV